MRQDIWVREGDLEAAGENVVDVMSTGSTTITIGKYSSGITLFMSAEDATTIATRILEALAK